MNKARREGDLSSVEVLTDAEKIAQVNEIVKWTLWQIATMDPEKDGPLGEIPHTHYHIIHGAAEQLFTHPRFVAEVTGSYLAKKAREAADDNS